MRHLFRRAAVLTAVALTLSTVGAPAQAQRRAAPDRGDASAAWLAGLVKDGSIFGAEHPDYGLAIDLALGLDALDRRAATIGQINKAVRGNVEDYITGEQWGDVGSTYSGATAKALVMAQAAGSKPRHYGGFDLVALLEATVATEAPITGRIVDSSSFGDYANVLGQSYAVRGLTLAGSDQAEPALSFLLQQQCSAGYFRLYFTEAKDAADQTCDGDSADASAPDTDATAVALISLLALDSPRADVDNAIKAGVRWLKDTQRDNGSFGGGPSTKGPNANSTGLAAWALAARGACAPAVDAARWVSGLQIYQPAKGSKLAKHGGAIAYNRAALKAARVHGITFATRDQWRRTTAQAAPAMDLLTAAACRRF